jgi:glycosyltransferase involved in cell wall biosynthesis
MKISFILPIYSTKPVGGYKVVYEYANNLIMLGHDVSIIHPCVYPVCSNNFGEQFKNKLKLLRNESIYQKVNWENVDSKVQILHVPDLKAIYIPEADVIIATAWKTAELAAEYPDSKGRKYYLIQHYETWDGPEEMVNATWRSPLKKVVIAKWLYAKGLELGVNETDMVHIPNGIDIKKFNVYRDIKKREQCVSMLYSNLDWKGSEDGIRALQMAKENHPKLKAKLFGTVPKPSSLPEWIEYFKNPRKDVLINEIYNDSSIYLCPSWMEGWGLPPAESMACGCAVVSTDNGGIKDYAIHEQTALLSTVRVISGLAFNLNRLLDDDLLRSEIAMRGHKNIQNFTWEKATDKLVDFISKT